MAFLEYRILYMFSDDVLLRFYCISPEQANIGRFHLSVNIFFWYFQYSDEPTLSRPQYGDSTADTASVASSDSSHAQKYLRSASISVASEPTSTGLSFILDMDKEEAVEHSQSLHEDIEKMFDKSPS